jgi:hypothetical protein
MLIIPEYLSRRLEIGESQPQGNHEAATKWGRPHFRTGLSTGRLAHLASVVKYIVALGWAKQRKSGWAILEYYRQLAEQSREERSEVMIRLKVPPGASNIYTITGRAILVPADRTIEVSEHEGKPLLALGYDRL